MLTSHQIEELIGLITSLDRPAVTRRLVDFHAGFPVDFTPEFLAAQSVDRLRHLLFALCVQNHHVPDAREFA